MRTLGVLPDCALRVALADLGLRVFKACGPTRGQLDSSEGKVTIAGIGNKEAQVRFSPRAAGARHPYVPAGAGQD